MIQNDNIKRSLALIHATIEFCENLKEEHPDDMAVEFLLFNRLSNIYALGFVSKNQIIGILQKEWFEEGSNQELDYNISSAALEQYFVDLLPTENNFQLLEDNPDGFVGDDYLLHKIRFNDIKLFEWPEIRNGELFNRSAN